MNTGAPDTVKARSKLWFAIVRFTLWLTSSVVAFVTPPTLWEFEAGIVQTVDYRIGVFVAASLTGLMFVPMQRWRKDGHLKKWWFAAVALFVGGLTMYFVYADTIGHWTARYGGARITIGPVDQMLPGAAQYFEEQRQQSTTYMIEDLIMDSGGMTTDIWNGEVLVNRRRVIVIVYIATIALLTLFILACTQSIEIGGNIRSKVG